MMLSTAVSAHRRRRKFETTRWADILAAQSAGGEAAMIRFLDDPDVPCYAPGWLKADKNRFHQERAPGSAKKYVQNPNLWAAKYNDNLTCVSVAAEWTYPGSNVANEGWCAKRGVVAVTPQHIASCGHAPIGLGTAASAFLTRVRFLGTDGETYDRYLVGQKYCHSNSSVMVNGAPHAFDSWIGTLDEPLPPAVHIARTIPYSWKMTYGYANRQWDTLFVCQSHEAESATLAQPAPQHDFYQDWVPPNYPLRHRSMVVRLGTPSTADSVYYRVWPGDSGMPKFIGIGNELFWAGFCAGGGAGPDAYPRPHNGGYLSWDDLVNQMILDSDADAISRAIVTPTNSSMTTPTGYTILPAVDVLELL